MRPGGRRLFRPALAIVAALFFVRGSCGGSTRKPVQPGAEADELASKEARAFRKDAAAFYGSYKTLSVSFTLKGKVNGEELYYEGELSSTDKSLKINLKDAVFLSPLITLEIGKDRVTLKDHARNKTETIPRADYQWVELFGRSFPIRFFEPLMRGFLPEDALAEDSTFAKTPAGEILVRSYNNSFEAAMYFAEARLKKIFYRDKVKGEILIFHLGTPFKNRSYPQTLKIEHSRMNDYLALTFRGLRVTGSVATPAGDTPPAKK
jgi:hypothetical protein